MAHKNHVQRRTVRVTVSEPVFQALQRQADLIGLSAASYMALATREYMQRDQLVQAIQALQERKAEISQYMDPDQEILDRQIEADEILQKILPDEAFRGYQENGGERL